MGGESGGVESAQDRRRFVAALVGGQSGALLGLVVFGGVLAPMFVAFLGSVAGALVLARRPYADSA